MVYVLEILNYQPFYIQTDADEVAIDTTTWGMVAKTNPFLALPTPKEPFKNEWLDEDGDDEYNAQMHYEAFEFDVQFYIKCFDTPEGSASENITRQIGLFFDKVKNGEFRIYDSYTSVGRRRVRYAGYSEEKFKKRYKFGDGWARVIFTIKFKVNDPITRMRLYNGSIVEE